MFSAINGAFDKVNKVLNKVHIINLLVSENRRIVPITKCLAIAENRQIYSLYRDTMYVLRFPTFPKKHPTWMSLCDFVSSSEMVLRQQTCVS